MFATQVSTSAARSERLVSKHGYQVEAAQRARRHARIRKYVSGTAARPRLCVTRSTRHMFVQVIDDVKGVTLASASTMEAELRAAEPGTRPLRQSALVSSVAERAKAAGVEAVVFDRGGNKYHGRVAAVADGAREGGLAL